MAAEMRINDRIAEGLAALDEAEPLADEAGLALDLSRLHHLRGNLLFPLGRDADCVREHELARRLARDAGPLLDRLMLLARADIAASAYPEPEKLDELQSRLDSVRAELPSRLAPLITGEEIMRVRGIGPGREVGRIKQKLEELVIDGEIPPQPQAVIDYLSEHQDL